MHSLLLVGLGNPGKEYENTRHNAGLDFVRMLCDKYEISLEKEKLVNGYYAKLNINDCSVILYIPDSFMNESGLAVSKAKKFFQVENHDILIVHDDLDLELGKVKIKLGGGNGGHNGLSSIDEMIGNDYYRIRVGIDHPGMKHLVSNYVLNKFNEDEINKIENQLDNITKNFEILLNDTSLFLTKLAEGK